MKWGYGSVYKKYNMESAIELPNNSMVQVYDWTNGIPSFMKKADTLFVDPPWNKGNVNSFYYKADKNYTALSFNDFSLYLFKAIKQINPSYLFIEMGKEYLSWFIEECKKIYKYVTFYNSTYYKNNKNKCYIIHATNFYKKKRYKELEDLDEEKIIEWICTNHDYECIGDLCMGTGLVGKYAFLNKKSFVGIELNKKRLALLLEYIYGNNNL